MALSEPILEKLAEVRLDDHYQNCPCWTAGLSVRRKVLFIVRKETKRGSKAVVLGHTSFLIVVNYTIGIITLQICKSNICAQTDDWDTEKEDYIRDIAPQYVLTNDTIVDKSRLIDSGVAVIDEVLRSKLNMMQDNFHTWEVGHGTRLGVACCLVRQRASKDYELVSMASYDPERY